ncbi:Phytochrome-like protein cph2 [compost metagenome]
MLKRAADIIRDTAANSHGIAARMGGDEFIMYISNSPSKQHIQTIIEKMQLSLSQFMIKYGTTPVAMSIGVSYYPTDGKDGQALINIADNAMYEMKRSHS